MAMVCTNASQPFSACGPLVADVVFGNSYQLRAFFWRLTSSRTLVTEGFCVGEKKGSYLNNFVK